jgi:hypothetical protein
VRADSAVLVRGSLSARILRFAKEAGYLSAPDLVVACFPLKEWWSEAALGGPGRRLRRDGGSALSRGTTRRVGVLVVVGADGPSGRPSDAGSPTGMWRIKPAGMPAERALEIALHVLDKHGRFPRPLRLEEVIRISGKTVPPTSSGDATS